MRGQAFPGPADSVRPTSGEVLAVNQGTLSIRIGATVLKNVSVAAPLDSSNVVVGDYVGLLWHGEKPFAYVVLNQESSAREAVASNIATTINRTINSTTMELSAHAITGPYHSESGLTTGHVLTATGASTFDWQESEGVSDHGDLTGLSDDDHTQYAKHSETETIAGAWTFTTNVGANAGITFDGVDLSSLITAQFVTLSASGDLSNERVLTGGDGIDLTDGGAGSTITVAVDITDFIDTDYGLVENSNDIRLNVGTGLTFNGGALYAYGLRQSDDGANALVADAEGDMTAYGGLTFDSAETIATNNDGNLTFAPTGDVVFDPVGNDILPLSNYDLNIGMLTKKYLTLHAAELWVETLVAHETLATVGGRILVGPTTTLTQDLSDSATTIVVKHNGVCAVDDNLYMEANGAIEFLLVSASLGATGTGQASGYGYTVTRNRDGSGANAWPAGTAVFNTGTTDDGWIDLYSVQGIAGAGIGPTIAGNVRTDTGYNDWVEHWAIGNLNGLYNYGVDTYGVGLGKYGANHVVIDASNGIRFRDSSDNVLGQLTGTTWTLGNTTSDHLQITSSAVNIRTDASHTAATFAATTTFYDTAGADRLVLSTSGITVGDTTEGEYVIISSSGLGMYANAVQRIGITSAGVLTIEDSGGAPVFTFDSSAGAEFTKPLTIGSSGGIYQGTGTFSSPTTGLKIYNSSGLGALETWYGGFRDLSFANNVIGISDYSYLRFTDHTDGDTTAQIYVEREHDYWWDALEIQSGFDDAGRINLIASAPSQAGTAEFRVQVTDGTATGEVYCYIDGTSELKIDDGGVKVAHGLYVGGTGTDPTTGTITAYSSSEGALIATGGGTGNSYSSVKLTDGGGTSSYNWQWAHRTSSDIDHALRLYYYDEASYYPVITGLPADKYVQLRYGAYIGNENTNSDMTLGLTINQGAYDDEALCIKSSDVGHGAYLGEADTYCHIQKAEALAGGAAIRGWKDSGGVGGYAMALQGFLDEAADETKSTSAIGIVDVGGYRTSAGALVGSASNQNVFVIRTYRSGSDVAVFIIDGDGDIYMDGASPSAYDDYDDALALQSLADGLVQNWNDTLDYNFDTLREMGVIAGGDREHPFISTKRLNMLLMGAIGQLYDRCNRLERKLLEA